MKRAGQRLDEFSKMAVADRLEWQENSRWAIVRHHLAENPFYKSLATNVHADDWTSLPVLTKKNYQAPLTQLISSGFKDPRKLYVGNTSGSSGQPFIYAKDKYAHALTWAEIRSLYRQHNLFLSARQARFYGIPLSGKGYWIETIKDRIANRKRFPVFDLSPAVLDKWIGLFSRDQFDYLYGYTSSMVFFARYCKEKQIVLKDICPSLSLCIVTSETCTKEDRHILETGFGVKVVNEYGASEVGLIAFENPLGKWKLCNDLLYIEAVDEQNKPVPDGQPGRLLITALFNKAMPFIRYEIGDIGVIQRDQFGAMELLSLEGRTNDFVRLPSGKISPGLTFYYISRSLLEQTGFINEFIIKQIAINTLEFVIHAKRPILEADRNLIQAKMDEYLEPGLNLIIKEVDKIERPKSGKLKHFYSEIN